MSGRRHLIFINYRKSDQYWATELVYARMTQAFGVEAVFKAGNSIQIGETFPPILSEQAAACPVLLACIGPGWLAADRPDGGRGLDLPDDWVRREIAISLRAGNHVIPLLIGNQDEVTIPRADQVPEDIRDMVYHQVWRLTPGVGLDLTVPALVARLAELVPELAERRRAVGSAPSPAESARDDAPQDARRGTYHQTNIAHGGGTIFAVQNGNQYVNFPDPG